MSKEDKVKTNTQTKTTTTNSGTGNGSDTSSDADNSDLGKIRMILNGLDKVENSSDTVPINERKDKK